MFIDMKNQDSANCGQSLQESSDTYIPEAWEHEYDVSNATSSSSDVVENHQKSFFIQSKEFFSDSKFIIYFYAPGNIYYKCSLDSIRAQKEVSKFLEIRSIDIKKVRQDSDILENIVDLAAFHKDFLKYFSRGDSVFYVDSNNSSSEDSDSSDAEDIEGCEELTSPDHNSDIEDSRDPSDSASDIEIIELSKNNQGIEE